MSTQLSTMLSNLRKFTRWQELSHAIRLIAVDLQQRQFCFQVLKTRAVFYQSCTEVFCWPTWIWQCQRYSLAQVGRQLADIEFIMPSNLSLHATDNGMYTSARILTIDHLNRTLVFQDKTGNKHVLRFVDLFSDADKIEMFSPQQAFYLGYFFASIQRENTLFSPPVLRLID